MASDTGTLCLFRHFNQLPGYVDQRRLAAPGRCEEAFRGVLAINMAAVLREIYIAKDGVRRTLVLGTLALLPTWRHTARATRAQ